MSEEPPSIKVLNPDEWLYNLALHHTSMSNRSNLLSNKKAKSLTSVITTGDDLTSSTVVAVVTPPAFWKAQGKLSSPAPSADFSIMNTAPNEPSRGGSAWDEEWASRLMLSRASSSMTPEPEITHSLKRS